MRKPTPKSLFKESEDYRKTIPKTSEIRNTLIALSIFTVGFIIFDITWKQTQIGYLARLILSGVIIKLIYDSYKITKVFEKWERNYKKYKSLFE